MSNTQTIEIMNVIETLPTDKLATVKDFVLFLREQSKESEAVDESDEWSDEDLRDFAAASTSHAEEFKETEKTPKKTPAEFLAEIAALPTEGKGEKFSNRDHDRILYGKANEK